MIISIPTQQGMMNFCLNASILKLLAMVAGLLVLVVGYVVVQLSTFLLNCSPEQFLRIVLFTVFTVGFILLGRFLLSKAGAK